ncbi:acyl carrier protein, partial [Streptomyces hydrogenans]
PGYPFAGPRLLSPAATVRTAPPTAPAPTPGPAPEADAAPARTPGDLVAARWTELLGRPGLAPDADFFDLGGDSLLVVRLAHRLGEDLGVRVPVRSLLTGPTLAEHTALAASLLLAGDPR